jgi:hypothetical protein
MPTVYNLPVFIEHNGEVIPKVAQSRDAGFDERFPFRGNPAYGLESLLLPVRPLVIAPERFAEP